jgi:hypothetical protein
MHRNHLPGADDGFPTFSQARVAARLMTLFAGEYG